MNKKIARITQEKKLLLANEVIESNAKTSLNSDGRLEVDEIIEYPVELEGGRNLIRNSDFSFGGDMWDGNFNITEEGALLESVAGRADYIQSTTLIPEGEYVVQIRYRVVEGQAPYLFVVNGTDMRLPQGLFIFEIGDNEWQTVTFPVIVNSESRFYAIRYAAGTPIDHLEGKTLIKWIKLEKGSIATPWTPAPEDLGLNYPDSIQNFNSSISGDNIIAPEFIEGYPFVKPVIDDSLVLWLDGSTGNNYEKTNIWKDLSGNGNDGQLMNFDFTEDSGWVDGGLKFDGVDDYVKTSFIAKFNEPFTLSLIGEFSDITIDNWGILRKPVTPPYEFAFYQRDDSFFRFVIWKKDGNTLAHLLIPIKDIYNSKDLTFRNTMNDLSVFLDGNLTQSVNINQNQWDDHTATDKPLEIGIAGYAGNQKHGKFLLKSIKWYSRALTDEEILQNYQAGQCSPLLAMRGEVIG